MRLFPPLRASWPKRGEQAAVVISGSNAKAVLFSSINATTGRQLFLALQSQTAEDFQIFLQFVRHHYRGWNIVMLLDGDSCHTAGTTKLFAQKIGVKSIRLPLGSPELNPMESL